MEEDRLLKNAIRNAPKRPFNYRGNTCKRKGKHSRVTNELKKKIYEELRAYGRR